MSNAPTYSRKYGQFDQMQNFMYAVGRDGNKSPSLRYGNNKHNFPTVVVNTNVPEDENNDYGRITYNTDLPNFLAYLKRMKEFGEGKHEPGTKFGFEYHNRFASKDRTTPLHLSTLEIGRYDDGRVYTAVLSMDSKRPRIPFFFGPHLVTRAHKLTRNGEEIPPAELSNEYAYAFADMIHEVLMDAIIRNHNPHTKSVAMSKPDQELRDPYLEQLETERKKAFGRKQANNGGGNRGGYNNQNNYNRQNNNNNNYGGQSNYNNQQQSNQSAGGPPPYQGNQQANGAPSDTIGSDFSDFPDY